MDKFDDIADKLFILNNTTVEKLFELGSDAYILYSFYYKTAKWQNTTAPWATNEYVMECLHWGLQRVRTTKQLLENNGFIEQDKITTETGTIKRWVIRLKYIEQATSPVLPPVDSQKADDKLATRPKIPPVVNEGINTSNNKISNNNYNNNKKENKNNKLFLQKKAYGEFENVMLTEDELKKLIKSYGWYLTDAIEKLSSYLAYKGDKYKSHYAVFAKNNWVWKEVHNDPECGSKPKLDYVMDDTVPGGMRLQTPTEYYFKKYNLSE